MPPTLRCRLFGHRWRFGVDGADVVWSCERCHDAGGRRRYADPAQARYHAAYFDRGRPKPPVPFVAAFGGLMPGGPRARQDRQAKDDEQR